MKIYSSADQLIGHTPLLELCGIEKAFNLKARIFGKLEYFNLTGSVKDRVEKEMLDDAEEEGLICKDSVIWSRRAATRGSGLRRWARRAATA